MGNRAYLYCETGCRLTTMTETVTSADGTQITFKRTGHGPPLVLIHGVSHDHVTTWDSVLPALSDQFTVYAVDRRGHGESGDAAEYTLEREVEDIVALVEALDESPHVFGHSFGGLIALEAALDIELRSLLLYESINIDPPSRARITGTDKTEALFKEGESEKALTTFLQDVFGVPPGMVEGFKAQPTWKRRVENVSTVPREVRAVDAYEFDPSKFTALDTPTAVFTGGQSPESQWEYARTVTEGLPNARLILLPRQGHAPMIFAPDVFVTELVKCINGIDATP